MSPLSALLAIIAIVALLLDEAHAQDPFNRMSAVVSDCVKICYSGVIDQDGCMPSDLRCHCLKESTIILQMPKCVAERPECKDQDPTVFTDAVATYCKQILASSVTTESHVTHTSALQHSSEESVPFTPTASTDSVEASYETALPSSIDSQVVTASTFPPVLSSEFISSRPSISLPSGPGPVINTSTCLESSESPISISTSALPVFTILTSTTISSTGLNSISNSTDCTDSLTFSPTIVPTSSSLGSSYGAPITVSTRTVWTTNLTSTLLPGSSTAEASVTVSNPAMSVTTIISTSTVSANCTENSSIPWSAGETSSSAAGNTSSTGKTSSAGETSSAAAITSKSTTETKSTIGSTIELTITGSSVDSEITSRATTILSTIRGPSSTADAVTGSEITTVGVTGTGAIVPCTTGSELCVSGTGIGGGQGPNSTSTFFPGGPTVTIVPGIAAKTMQVPIGHLYVFVAYLLAF